MLKSVKSSAAFSPSSDSQNKILEMKEGYNPAELWEESQLLATKLLVCGKENKALARGQG